MSEGKCCDVDSRKHDGVYCSCSHHKVIPLLVLVGGVFFLLQAIGSVSVETNAIVWPVLVILGAIVKLAAGKCGCYNKKS